jgi:hypothetical protein
MTQRTHHVFCLVLSVLFVLLFSLCSFAQTSTLSGAVQDQKGAVIQHASIVLTNVLTNTANTTTTNNDGIYLFTGLVAGTYNLQTSATGFNKFDRRGIILEISQHARVDVVLNVGEAEEQIVVNANASALHFDTDTLEYDISPDVESDLPLLVTGAPSNAYTFAALLPGVATTQGTNDASSLRINGGVVQGQEAITDGISMQEGGMGQGGTIGLGDFPMSPDVISEVKIMVSNYGPQYGGTTSGVIIQSTKSGTDEFHGSAYEYLRNIALNATKFHASAKSPDNEHQFGGGIGGPIKTRFAWSPRNKTFFYFNYQQYEQKGGVNPPVITIPTLKNRQGDFSDQLNASGKLIPIYDPATTHAVNGGITRSQFMGCDGLSPNVICQTRLDSTALAFNKYLPTPTNSNPTYNYQVPRSIPDNILEGSKQFFGKIDEYVGDADHVAVTLWHQQAPQKWNSQLPIQIASETVKGNPESSWVNRLNWDHTLTASMLNHFAFGYLNRREGTGSLNYKYANVLPQIQGVSDPSEAPPVIAASGYATYGNTYGNPAHYVSGRPTYIWNDLFTLVKGTHTISAGGEFRYLTMSQTQNGNAAGTFNFTSTQTGLIGISSGNAEASFLLGAVGSASSTFYSSRAYSARQHAGALFIGDQWRHSAHLTLNYGVRWEYWSPGTETHGNDSWLDISRANPDAGGRLGSLVFGTEKAGTAYAGTHAPELSFYKGFAPRLGFIYAPSNNMTVTLGYGISYDQLFYPDYSDGARLQAGLNNTASYSSTTNSGLDPAFYLSSGFPGNSIKTLPYYSLGAVNGGDSYSTVAWRNPKDGRLPYSQQWNLSIERSIKNNVTVKVNYVGSKGTHLYTAVSPINTLPISYLSLGKKLYDTFASGSTVVDGVSAPYSGWASQMKNCTPTVAQALLPYPQYCQQMTSLTESDGYSSYHSLQLSGQKRFSSGLFVLSNFTWSKLIGTPGTEFGASQTSNAVFSKDQKWRYHTLASSDLPYVFNFSVIYSLPFGKSKRYFGNASPIANALVGGWDISEITRVNGGSLMSFTALCTVPSAFGASGCYPELVPGQKIRTLSQGDINKSIIKGVSYQAYNPNAFAWQSIPSYTVPLGPLYATRGFGYKDFDASLTKKINIGERVKVKISGQFFNVFNQHSFGKNFGTNLTGTTFGVWNGSVSNPRNGQLTGRIVF